MILIVTASVSMGGIAPLWGRVVPGVGPFALEVLYDRGYGLRLRTVDGAEFWLGSDGIIPTGSSPGWTSRFAPDLVAEIATDADDFYRIACTIGGYIVFPRNCVGQTATIPAGLNRPHRADQRSSDALRP